MQAIAGGLDAAKIEALLRKWLAILPQPFTPEDQEAGYHYYLSIQQAEFLLTQVLDAPRQERLLFEQINRDNLDIGRPSQVQLLFLRRITKPRRAASAPAWCWRRPAAGPAHAQPARGGRPSPGSGVEDLPAPPDPGLGVVETIAKLLAQLGDVPGDTCLMCPGNENGFEIA